MKNTFTRIATGMLAFALLFSAIPANAQNTSFAERCQTYGFYGLDDWFHVQLQDMTGNVSNSCKADDWSVTMSSGETNVFGEVVKSTQEVKVKRADGGGMNVRAKSGSEMTNDNYIMLVKANSQTSSTQEKVFITASSLNAEGYQQVQTNYYNPNGSTEDAIVFNLNVKNTGTKAFDPLEPDPFNAGNSKWRGAVGCGALVNPVSLEYEGQVLLPELSPNESKIAKAYLYRAQSALTRIQNGEVLPCHIIPLSAYSNIQRGHKPEVSLFDLYYNGKTDKIEIANFRRSNEKRSSTLQNVETGKRTSSSTPIIIKTVPPAGYEDEVITNYQHFNNPFPDTNLETLEGEAASELYRRAVIRGFSDGEFKGYRDVNRAEATKFLLLARYGTVADISNNGKFPDVKDGEWYVPFVITAANKGIINGYPDGLFRPANTVNTAEFLKMLTLTFSLSKNLDYSYSDVKSTDWFAKYAGIAEKYNLFPDRSNYLKPKNNLTRKEVAIAIYQYLLNR